jgi:hypothetical protein
LGVVLFELLTARPLFAAPSAAELVVEILHKPAPPLRMFRPDAPVALEAVLARATSKAREERFASADSFANAVRQSLVWGAAPDPATASASARAAMTAAPPSPLAVTSFAAPSAPQGQAPPQALVHYPQQHEHMYRAMPMMMPMTRPPSGGGGGGKALIATGGVVTSGGVLAFVAAAIPHVVNSSEIGTAIGIGVAACIVGGSLLVGGFSLLKR